MSIKSSGHKAESTNVSPCTDTESTMSIERPQGRVYKSSLQYHVAMFN